ncbi:hypothetical protein A3J90_06010 [candidate division WOR-1 bacterium RIFOXYC2_FULL_37_10]|uniref:Uncharacterized protein n=1 Tax=candidate division WOR-1 bacterium RIFOXYB2_FULL_37_13 TaxID=1802579 RepID=A0A1F4SWE6_UNCSA|nr:MAG: hypothetical protein A2310_04635 [candidate division WOR-1 bacterium RIFOXYB2_FULL_37_13]OGC34789.1 MAG: hypothetical protein A3J90_06010 [candidate division WOR-1 bacterium RIFOXYC2_FULL_37_10]
MQIIKNKTTINELKKMSAKMFGNMVKAVVDIEKNIMAVDAGLHADEEALLIENGSNNANLWGINIYPELYGTSDYIEFDSMINIRPLQENKTRNVENAAVREKILKTINQLIKNE